MRQAKMKYVQVRPGSREAGSIAQAAVADSLWDRFWGLMGRRHLEEGHALLIEPCSSVHTMFMRFTIDVVYLSEENDIVKIAHRVGPFRLSAARGARRVLEMRAGAAESHHLAVGDQLFFTDAE